MPYVAHAAFQLSWGVPPEDKGFWRTIKQVDGVEYRWKFAYDGSCHVLAGVFKDPNAALACAKQVHVTLFYTLMRRTFGVGEGSQGPQWGRFLFHPERELTIEGHDGNEKFFFWNKRNVGGWTGPGVFEVERSIDEFDEYRFIFGTIADCYGSWKLDLTDIDKPLFTYCREAQEYFDTIMFAENASDCGLQMTVYCGLLEHLSESVDKDHDTLAVINQLIEHVDESDLSPNKKDSLRSFLSSGRKVSSRQRCRDLCARYAKPDYCGHPCKEILDEAYGLRSTFSHGGKTDDADLPCVLYMKYVVLDVVEGYMREKEKRSARALD